MKTRKTALPALAEERDDTAQHYVLSGDEEELIPTLPFLGPTDPHGMPTWRSVGDEGSHRSINQTSEEECLPLPPDHFGAHVASVPQDDNEERVPVATQPNQAWGQGSAEPGELPFTYVPPPELGTAVPSPDYDDMELMPGPPSVEHCIEQALHASRVQGLGIDVEDPALQPLPTINAFQDFHDNGIIDELDPGDIFSGD